MLLSDFSAANLQLDEQDTLVRKARGSDPTEGTSPNTGSQIWSEAFSLESAGLKITAGQRTLSGLIGALTGQTFVLQVMLTGHFAWSHS